MAVAEDLIDAEFAVSGAYGVVDFDVGKNEAIVDGVVGLSFVLIHKRDIDEVIEVLLLLVASDFLDVAELGDEALELAGEALGVHAQVGERLRLTFERRGDGEGVLDSVADGGEVEEIGFERGGAVESPGSVGEGLDEVGLGGSFGVVFVDERFHVTLVGGEVLGGHDDDLAGESVAEGVEG